MADDRLHEAMIKKAIQLARKGQGQTSPNPLVGAVIYNSDGIIATGYHRKAGEAHAERIALAHAGERARGAALAVNLEPCCHQGRTGPCTEAIVAAGITEVVYSIRDPFREVRGRGAQFLKEHGINVVNGVCREEALRLNEIYLHYVTTGRPFVALKTAQSLDGRIATGRGDSQWISSPEALAFGHRLRACHDAVVVGGETVRIDNPRLTVRRVKGRNPMRIVLTSKPDISPTANIFDTSPGTQTVVATTREVISRNAYSFASAWRIRKSADGLDLARFLEQAGKSGITSILVEGGQRLATSFLKRNLVNKLYVLIAPLIIGAGVDAVGDLGVQKLTQAIRLGDSGSKRVGTNIVIWGYPEKE
jgi:diaminohydroxyphosphoribosylaminopyrimidine deaminase/5-amino-6-(5-phosphoribosylamino)uracil reductase